MDTAKIFAMADRRLSVCRRISFDTTEVRIRRHGSSVILEPVPQDWAYSRR